MAIRQLTPEQAYHLELLNVRVRAAQLEQALVQERAQRAERELAAYVTELALPTHLPLRVALDRDAFPVGYVIDMRTGQPLDEPATDAPADAPAPA